MPSDPEEEYFIRVEAERLRTMAAERHAELEIEEREKARALHHMKCPKCGMQLQEISFGTVRIDKCFSCEGLWLDKGELEIIQKQGSGFIGKFLHTFRA